MEWEAVPSDCRKGRGGGGVTTASRAVAVRSRGSSEHSRMRPCVQGTEPCRVPLGPGWKGTCSPSGVYNSVLSH